MGDRSIHVECTTRGDSDATRDRWATHSATLEVDPEAVHFERQDSYTAGRMLYGTVYNKLAPDNDVGKSQLMSGVPNILLISLNSATSDVRSDTPSIGWALDELFDSQPNGGKTPISLQECLLKDEGRKGNFDSLVSAPRNIGAVMLFDGCQFKHARVNYNAYDACRISHGEIALLEEVFFLPPAYWP